jgi:hypothetical protein
MQGVRDSVVLAVGVVLAVFIGWFALAFLTENPSRYFALVRAAILILGILAIGAAIIYRSERQVAVGVGLLVAGLLLTPRWRHLIKQGLRRSTEFPTSEAPAGLPAWVGIGFGHEFLGGITLLEISIGALALANVLMLMHGAGIRRFVAGNLLLMVTAIILARVVASMFGWA